MLLTEEQASKKRCPHHAGKSLDCGERTNVKFCVSSSCAIWVEIEPGKGVMGCNPVMAKWAADRLVHTLVEAGKPIEIKIQDGAKATRTTRTVDGAEQVFIDIKVPQLNFASPSAIIIRSEDMGHTIQIIGIDGKAGYVVGHKRTQLRIEIDHPVPDEVLVQSGGDTQSYAKACIGITGSLFIIDRFEKMMDGLEEVLIRDTESGATHRYLLARDVDSRVADLFQTARDAGILRDDNSMYDSIWLITNFLRSLPQER